MVDVLCWMRVQILPTLKMSTNSFGRILPGIITQIEPLLVSSISNISKYFFFDLSKIVTFSGLFYHAAWFTQPHNMEGFQRFLDTILSLNDVWFVTSWQAIQWMRNLANPVDPLNFEPFQCKQTQEQVRTYLVAVQYVYLVN